MSFRINTNSTAMGVLRNLGNTNNDFTRSVGRLSTGMRIVSAADDPAGLIMSENFRTQINGITQAVRNNQDALNYTKTAEGALDELSRLLREGRALAVQSANSAVQDASQLQANQTQWNLIVQSINRIAGETSFGKKKLLDGSSGVAGSVVNSTVLKSMSMSGTFDGESMSVNGGMNVAITTAATKATTTGNRNTTGYANVNTYLGGAVGNNGQFSINGYQFQVKSTDTWGDVVAKINSASATTGVIAEGVHDGTNGNIKLTSAKWGSVGTFTLTDTGVLLGTPGTTTANGINAVANVTYNGNTVQFQGGRTGYDGNTLSDSDGNVIRLNEGIATGTYNNSAYVTVGSAQFQTGANAGQRATLSIGNFSSSTLGVDNLDLTTVGGSNAALAAMDAAVEELAKRRGDIGAFMRNILESNVRSLGVAKENLTASESLVRDIDMAEEMTAYTKLQILQQSGLSVLAQANMAPQAVLSLLQG